MLAAAARTALVLVGAMASAAAVGGDQAGRTDVLSRLGAYVDAWERELGSVVADETYEQTVVRTLRSGSVRGASGPPREARLLTSEFTLIHFDEGVSEWIGFRDVKLVDGKPVAVPGPTLNELMNDAQLTWRERWARVRDMSAAFNLGSIARDVNLPTFALAALRTVNQPRFSYSTPRTERLDGELLTAIDLRERVRPTLVSSVDGRDVPLAGTVWFDAHDGRVHRTEVHVRDRVPAPKESGNEHSAPDQDLSSRITVVFGAAPTVQAWVPLGMRERYDNAWGEVTTGRATYANYRRFRTSGRMLRPGA